MPETGIMARARSVRAFTLVELLVAMGVLGILVAIMAGALARPREAGRRTACLGNQRQIALALQLYGSDNGEQLPSGQLVPPESETFRRIYLPLIATNTQRALIRYLNDSNVLDCPNVHRFLVTSNAPGASWRNPLDARHQQIGYLYLAGRPKTPWPTTGPPVTAAWTSPQRLDDDPALAVLADLNYVAPYVGRIVVAHGHRGPYVRQLAGVEFMPAQAMADRVRALAIEGSNLARLDGSIEWRPSARLEWRRAAKETDEMDNTTCVAIW